MKSNPKITIAIDGYSACGKSTLAKQLAKELDYIFIDTGAMYRGITLYCIQNDLVTDSVINTGELIQQLKSIDIHFENNELGQPELFLNGKLVASEIRKPSVSNLVSHVAKIKEVRDFLVQKQRKLGEKGGVVMDGRDIGSVVFPNAELKLFITASIEVRTQRRYLELKESNTVISKEEIQDNLTNRDLIDSTRKESPLIQTEDAFVIDNSNITREEQLQMALQLANQRISKKKISTTCN